MAEYLLRLNCLMHSFKHACIIQFLCAEAHILAIWVPFVYHLVTIWETLKNLDSMEKLLIMRMFVHVHLIMHIC